ncbi:DUF998 domain-containing protein [Plantactinospora siamensis]|uniref:DUF998 domain-containing protein n=1 Tax=Plantactinospora siamensis TaxID=555372 RepID=A0ABV6P2H1_9ACTN
MRPIPPARAGALCWALAAPLFLAANLVTGLGWRHPPYSWATNNISDLGNVHCGVWDTTRPRYVCSPWHPIMNAGMLLTGALLAAGVLLTWRALGPGRLIRVARSLLLLAGVGFALAGVFPADADENWHFLAALLVLGAGPVGLTLAGLAPRAGAPGRLRLPTLAAGLLALTGAVLFVAQRDAGIGMGGMERVAALPYPIWACWIGITLFAAGGPARRIRRG